MTTRCFWPNCDQPGHHRPHIIHPLPAGQRLCCVHADAYTATETEHLDDCDLAARTWAIWVHQHTQQCGHASSFLEAYESAARTTQHQTT